MERRPRRVEESPELPGEPLAADAADLCAVPALEVGRHRLSPLEDDLPTDLGVVRRIPGHHPGDVSFRPSCVPRLSPSSRSCARADAIPVDMDMQDVAALPEYALVSSAVLDGFGRLSG